MRRRSLEGCSAQDDSGVVIGSGAASGAADAAAAVVSTDSR